MAAYEALSHGAAAEVMDITEFANALTDFLGASTFDRSQARLLYMRYAQTRLTYLDFCRMVSPSDKLVGDRLLKRVPRGQPLSELCIDELKLLLRALLTLE